MVEYRSFRNNDPPHLVEIWNESYVGRGAARLRHSSLLERHVYAKPYFEPAGLIVAEENGTRIGFAHVGYGPNPKETNLARNAGTVCALAVRTAYRKKGIGSELLRRAEDVLKKAGCQTLFAGLMRPFTPFYFGVYGGSDMPGVLASEAAADPFLSKHGYKVLETSQIYQRYLDKPVNVPDARFAALRRRFDVRILPRLPVGTWWQECWVGLIEPVEFRLEEKLTGKVAARATAWEMDAFSATWNVPSVGILDLFVRDDLRRQGLAKFLLTQILRYLQDQFFGVAEIHSPDTDQSLQSLYKSVSFEKSDMGRLYKKG